MESDQLNQDPFGCYKRVQENCIHFIVNQSVHFGHIYAFLQRLNDSLSVRGCFNQHGSK
jgi:hypothetical protein